MERITITIPTKLRNELEELASENEVSMNDIVIWSLIEKLGKMKLTQMASKWQNEPIARKSEGYLQEDKNQLLNPYEVAKLLKISKAQTYNLIRSGRLPAIHIGKCVRVYKSELEKVLLQDTDI